MSNILYSLIFLSFIILTEGKISENITDVDHYFHSKTDREGKFFGFLGWGIGVVRFANNVCNSSSTLNGTCYTKRQCSEINGIASGTCASNIGVCCVVQYTCGSSSSYNNTYFISGNYPSGVTGNGRCVYTIKPCSTDICQVRIDFLSATLAQPDGDGRCVNDSIRISGGTVPVLCGENTGQHVYVDFYNNQDIQIVVTTTAGETLGRNWQFKVTQIACDCPTLAPAGCLQYHTGITGVVQSFNYGSTESSFRNMIGATGTRQLANTNYGICVKPAPGFCSITWSPSTTNSFTVSHDTEGSSMIIGRPSAALNGTNCTQDFVVVPAPMINGVVLNTDRFCGNYFPTMTTNSRPFVLTVHTNENDTSDVANRGFSLKYEQHPCNPQIYPI